MKSPTRFANALDQALHQIKTTTKKKILVVEDEIGNELNYSGRHYVEWLRRGNVPTKQEELEKLVEKIKSYGCLSQEESEKLLHYGGHVQAHNVAEVWYGMKRIDGRSAAENGELKPFVVGPPIKQPRQFFGRQHELQRIFTLVEHSPLEHVAILGPRRSGKSSLLNYLCCITSADESILRPQQRTNWLAEAENYRWLLIDFLNPRMHRQEVLLQRLLTTLEMQAPAHCTLDDFMAISESHVVAHPTIILMDEVEVVLQSGELDQRFWDTLRALLNGTGNGNLSFVITSTHPLAQMAKTWQQSAPFFSNFRTLQLGPFSDAEACELIASSPLPIPADDAEWILQQSGGWPILVQLLCAEWLLARKLSLERAVWQAEGVRQLADYQELLGW